MKRTATNHEATTAKLPKAKMEDVYSPAALFAKPIGTKPAIVTNEPVSIGNANVLYANVAACSFGSPSARRAVMASIVLMASSTSNVSAMMRAPSEMRCRSILTNCMTGNTIASVSGIESATIAPALIPRLTMLTAMMIAIACHNEVMNSPIALRTTDRNCGFVGREGCRSVTGAGGDAASLMSGLEDEHVIDLLEIGMGRETPATGCSRSLWRSSSVCVPRFSMGWHQCRPQHRPDFVAGQTIGCTFPSRN